MWFARPLWCRALVCLQQRRLKPSPQTRHSLAEAFWFEQKRRDRRNDDPGVDPRDLTSELAVLFHRELQRVRDRIAADREQQLVHAGREAGQLQVELILPGRRIVLEQVAGLRVTRRLRGGDRP